MDVLCVGELLVDFVAEQAGKLGEVQSFRKAAGGAPANVAVGLARLGHKVAFSGMVGTDPFGDWLKGVLEENSVDVSLLKQTEVARTTLAFVSLTEGGERDFVFYRSPGADQLLSLEHLNAGVVSKLNPRIFCWGGVALSTERCRVAITDALSGAGNIGAWRAFDPNFRLPLWSNREEMISTCRQMITQADILKVSEEEALDLIREDIEEPRTDEHLLALTSRILQMTSNLTRPALVVVTRGAKGSTWGYTRGDGGLERGISAPFKVEVVDTTGAGDAFFAAFLSGLLDAEHPELANLPRALLEKMSTRANMAAALTVQKRGAIPALPGRKDLFLQPEG